jgi:hypothetical protein
VFESIAMKRKLPGSKPKAEGARRAGSSKSSAASVKKPARAGSQLEKVLSLIKANPGIRPSEINRRLNLEQSDGVRSTLIKRRLIRKEKDGSAIRYYAV